MEIIYPKHFNGLDWSLLVKHLVIKDIHNSWLYCFTSPLELGIRVSLSHHQPYVLTVQEDLWNNITKSCVHFQLSQSVVIWILSRSTSLRHPKNVVCCVSDEIIIMGFGPSHHTLTEFNFWRNWRSVSILRSLWSVVFSVYHGVSAMVLRVLFWIIWYLISVDTVYNSPVQQHTTWLIWPLLSSLLLCFPSNVTKLNNRF